MNDDDLLTFDEALSATIENVFEEQGPHYSKEIKEEADKIFDHALSDIGDSETKSIATIVLAAGMVNSIVVRVLDEFGPAVVEKMLREMGVAYGKYAKQEEVLH